MIVNVDAMFLVCKHAIPAIVRTAGGGAIVKVSSISALRPHGLIAYTVSKDTVIALTKAIGSVQTVWPLASFIRQWSMLVA
jgi:NAD(P)-dependent dehydrogenase (short-subunit alcohol dehydrogenase family)